MSLDRFNKQMKIDINEASGISDKCKLKLIKLVEKHFMVDLPNENYLNIDIEILKNGNIKMRDIEYQTTAPVKEEKEIEERFNAFQEEADNLINKHEVSFESLTSKKERDNLIWVIIVTIAIAIIAIYSLRELFMGNLYGVLWIIIIIGYHVIPATGNSIRNRYMRAHRYIKSLIYKKKK
jgi:hypothetical protein